MKFKNIPKLKIGKHIAQIPVIQGGMGVGISMSGLASSVTNHGGIGTISTVGLGMFEKDFKTNFKDANKKGLIKEIREARKKTSGPIGLNIMVALTDFEELVEVAVEEKADILFLGAGLPLKLPASLTPEKLKDIDTCFVPIVSSARATGIIFQQWEKKFNYIPDGVVVEGPKAGGHLGFKKEQINSPDFTLENLIPEVIKTTLPYEQKWNKKIPVIAAGGVYSGYDIHKFLKMGASGVQLGTRFVATHECDADISFKKIFVESKENDIEIIDSPVGLPGRAIGNSFLSEVSAGIKKPFKCPWKCLKTCNFKHVPYCIAEALTNAKVGNLKGGFAFAGANVFRVKKIIHIKELFNILLNEYRKACLSF